MNWLADHFKTLALDEDHEGYFLGRGAKYDSIQRLGVRTWKPLPDVAPCPVFQERYGDPSKGGEGRGEWLDGWAVWPLYCPRGRILGFEGRPAPDKRVTRYLLGEAEWHPLWLGLTPTEMRRIWEGADIWIVEGIFDLFALEWAIPEGDVVLSSLRARLTFKHVEFLRRFARGPAQWVRMVYDNDETGRKGVHDWTDDTGKLRWGGLRRLDRVGVKAVEVKYRGKDPGDIWNQGGASAVRAAFAQ